MLKLPVAAAVATVAFAAIVAVCHHKEVIFIPAAASKKQKQKTADESTVVRKGPYLEPIIISLEYPSFGYAATTGCAGVVVHTDVLLASSHCHGDFLGGGHVTMIDGDEYTSHHSTLGEYPLDEFLLVVLEQPCTAPIAPLALEKPAEIPMNLTILGLQIEDLKPTSSIVFKAVAKTEKCPPHTAKSGAASYWCTESSCPHIYGGPVMGEDDETAIGVVHRCDETHTEIVLVDAVAIAAEICKVSNVPPKSCFDKKAVVEEAKKEAPTKKTATTAKNYPETETTTAISIGEKPESSFPVTQNDRVVERNISLAEKQGMEPQHVKDVTFTSSKDDCLLENSDKDINLERVDHEIKEETPQVVFEPVDFRAGRMGTNK